MDDYEEPKRRYIGCPDMFCGADDCPACHPENFRAGVYVGDVEETEEDETEQLVEQTMGENLKG